MQWPKHILDAFDAALGVQPVDGMTKLAVLRTLLDETARRAVRRANGNPAFARGALRTPYTPLGSVIGEGVNGKAARLSLGGPSWGDAVEAFHTYVEENAAEVFAAFADGVERDLPPE
jgi:hypothetical protein